MHSQQSASIFPLNSTYLGMQLYCMYLHLSTKTVTLFSAQVNTFDSTAPRTALVSLLINRFVNVKGLHPGVIFKN